MLHGLVSAVPTRHGYGLCMDARVGITGLGGAGDVSINAHLSGLTCSLNVMTTQKTMTRAQLGAWGEQLSVDHLIGLGLQILHRNWRCRYGELDVIASDEASRTLVFIEVKTRTGDGYGGVAQAVTDSKVRRLRRLAGLWLAGQNERWAVIRIDVIGVRVGRNRVPELTHLKGVG